MAEKTKVVEVVPYQESWSFEFERIKAMVLCHIGDLLIGVEHVGSTSVPGLAAKPVIDVDAVMESYELFPRIVERLERAGFKHQGTLGIPGREAFRRSCDDGLSKYHLYVCPKDGKGYLEHIALRDFLRADAAARERYQALKQQLAEAYRYDIDAYCDGKTAFIADILQKTLYAEKQA